MLTLEQVRNNPQILELIKKADLALQAMGLTDHGRRHVDLVTKRAREIAQKIGLTRKEQELSAIAGFCHDMGNCLGRTQHHYWGSLLFGQVFLSASDDLDGVTTVMQAIVNHDKEEIKILNSISAVVVLADKSDVHRSRVGKKTAEEIRGNIHNRVNYAVTDSRITVNGKNKRIILRLNIDTAVVPVMEYFEIFTERMTYCRQAAEYLGYQFGLEINKFKLL